MATLIEQLIQKMGLRDEPNVLEKTTELVRLLDLRSTNVPLQINEYGKIVLCADLAGALLGIAFDKEQALKLSGLRKSHYANHKRMFEKLLDLSKIVGVNDICIQLGLNQVAQKAQDLLDLYKRVVIAENADADVEHPQYAAMAVYYACKMLKQKVSKTKLMPFSNLRPTQWQQLEQRWEKLLAKHHKDTMDSKLKKNVVGEENEKKTSGDNEKSGGAEKRVKVETEDYEKWKQRMLKMATNGLKQQTQAVAVDETEVDSEMEKENMILGM